MRQAISLIIIVLCANQLVAQRNMNPSKKGDAFGKYDLRNLNNYGLQIQLGPTYMMTKLNNEYTDVATTTDGFRGNYTHDPYGKFGVYGEIGMFHFPKKRSKLSLALKTVLVSYYDWGVGFKYFRGGERIEANFMDPGGNVVSTDERSFDFSHGNVYGRFSIHKNIHFKRHRETINFFLDNSLGLNVDYRVLTGTDDYTWYGLMTANQRYTEPLQVQLHYGLGFGFRLKRGSYLIPGVRTPILGYQNTLGALNETGGGESSFGRPSVHWFSSRHWPLLIHVKYMFAFEKKAKGCPPVEVNDQDKNTMQNQ
jgi:hypothetical protein